MCHIRSLGSWCHATLIAAGTAILKNCYSREFRAQLFIVGSVGIYSKGEVQRVCVQPGYLGAMGVVWATDHSDTVILRTGVSPNGLGCALDIAVGLGPSVRFVCPRALVIVFPAAVCVLFWVVLVV